MAWEMIPLIFLSLAVEISIMEENLPGTTSLPSGRKQAMTSDSKSLTMEEISTAINRSGAYTVL